MTKTKLFLHKYLPRFFYKKFDGGKDSGVTGYFLIEWKKVFSIGLLHFKDGSREAFHNHAFNALSWFKGRVTEEKLDGTKKDFSTSIIPKFTPRTNCHRVISHGDTWCFTIRGPWKDTWKEVKNDKTIVLTHGRNIVDEIPTINKISGLTFNRKITDYDQGELYFLHRDEWR